MNTDLVMTGEERNAYILRLDDELLLGGVILSEWCTLITQQADIAFEAGADLAALLIAVSGIETHLRSESSSDQSVRLHRLIDDSGMSDPLKKDLHAMRRYRNRWVHVDEPWQDEELLSNPERTLNELESMSTLAMRLLRTVLYTNPWV